MELGGLFGSLLAGRISDALIAKNPKGGNVGKRVQASSILMNELPRLLTGVPGVPFNCMLIGCAGKPSLYISASLIFFACHPCLSHCRL